MLTSPVCHHFSLKPKSSTVPNAHITVRRQVGIGITSVKLLTSVYEIVLFKIGMRYLLDDILKFNIQMTLSMRNYNVKKCCAYGSDKCVGPAAITVF